LQLMLTIFKQTETSQNDKCKRKLYAEHNGYILLKEGGTTVG